VLAMSPAETFRLVGEVLAIAGVTGGGFYWLAKLLWRTHSKLDGVNDRLDTLNGTVAHHINEDAVIQQKMSEDIAFLKGRESVIDEGAKGRHDDLIVAASSAAALITNAATAAAKLIEEAKRKE